MLCEMCQKNDATVHLTQTRYIAVDGQEAGAKNQHFCKECADAYFASTPGMNPMREIICLSKEYRAKLLDLLEKTHPEAFDNSDIEACRRGSEIMRGFLREQLRKEKIEVNQDAFEMLCISFWSSEFYDRADAYRRIKGFGGS